MWDRRPSVDAWAAAVEVELLAATRMARDKSWQSLKAMH